MMCVCVCVHVYVYMHTVYVCVYMCVCVHMCVYMHTVYVCMCVCVCVYMHRVRYQSLDVPIFGQQFFQMKGTATFTIAP